ncbi:MAG: hypothetical protein DME97_05520 [Verrucomicrobia bacterium]|nr:MAG: hypothetical protein DME97_05520 [Verrucomicrobiota bacterium]
MSEQNKDTILELAANQAPFVFGVSGHRDLVRTDLPELRKQLHTVFDRFRSAYPNAAFELISPLAEGADRVAAEVALTCGVKLVVPLPMAQQEYERDFTTAESLSEFRRLLVAANSQWEVSEDSPNPSSSSDSNGRAQRYAAVGDLIARTSHVLILLWDGRDNEKVGGTAWVKKRREYWLRVAEEKGTSPDVFGYVGTIHIVTPRETAEGAARPRVEIIGELPGEAPGLR